MSSAGLDSLIFRQDDFNRYKGHHRLETFSLPRPLNDTSTKAVPSYWNERDITDWLQKPDVKYGSNSPTMNMLMIQTHNQLTSRKERLNDTTQIPEWPAHVGLVKDIFATLNLPLAAFGAYIKAHLTFVCVPSYATNDEDHHGNITRYYCSGTSWTITWAYYHDIKHTAAVMFHREGDGDDRKLEVIDHLLRLQRFRGHPMLLGYVKTKISLAFTFDMLDDMNRETLQLEKDIGFPTWNWCLDREESGSDIQEGHDHCVDRFNVLSSKLTNIRFRLRTFQAQIKFITRCNSDFQFVSPSSQTECHELKHMMNVIWDYTLVHLFDAEALSERLANQMQSINQIAAQRDARASIAAAEINNELAWQGKTTNSSMMTIAFVSLLFLPGTFVASFFDTPIFNWPQPDGSILVTEPFLIYWVVSGLLTILLCGGWFGYLQYKRVKDKKNRALARQKFVDKLRLFRNRSIKIYNSGLAREQAGDMTKGHVVKPARSLFPWTRRSDRVKIVGVDVEKGGFRTLC